MSSVKRYDVVVIGGGIVGVASARALRKRGVRSVLVLEAEGEVGLHQSSHNSGVIHSGLYYRPGSAKADNCIRGRELMYRYCERAGIPHRRCGKIVVATRTSEIPALEELRRRGVANGLANLRMLSREELRELEPEVEGIAGLHVREAGLADFGAVCRSMANDLRSDAGEILTGARVIGATVSGTDHVVESTVGHFHAAFVVNCAGLQCDRVARLFGVRTDVAIVPFRGEYYQLTPAASARIRNPIYPVPDPAFPFLGVHLTPTVEGVVEAGPNAVLAFKREGYTPTSVSLRDLGDVLTNVGFWRLARRHWRYGLEEVHRSLSKRQFTESLRRLVPSLSRDDLVPGKAGVRAQAIDRAGKLLDDFRIDEGPASLHVLNAPSPAATASLSIGEHIAQRVVARVR